MLINSFILDIMKNIVGSDILVSSIDVHKPLPERKLRDFLLQQQHKDKPTIHDYTFGSRSVNGLMGDLFGRYTYMKLYGGGKATNNKINIYPVEENFLNATFSQYYIPSRIQKGLNYPKINGNYDTIWSLYNDEGTDDYGPSRDKYHTISKNLMNEISPEMNNDFKDTDQIRIIIPEGISSVLSVKPGDTLGLRLKSWSGTKVYRSLIRAMPRKVPGYVFMSYNLVQFRLQGLISYDQTIDLIYDYVNKHNIQHPFIDGMSEYKRCRRSNCGESLKRKGMK
mmetsp:Transcript_18353/g.20526  ORF Transcript_18353/g.20526 Transcript_18353/m.20526 type:complete len:281 (-) Transcript_18353:606-1448(-)